ncbi:MAG TPA: ectonucleotide pyrophosphatase/phosphodiesterase, partial [Vicinamibacteria bacterium]|nr:ectonucleotide pyrophosphatase/phosphodiesterase [Vicinamibacteria bacterium]
MRCWIVAALIAFTGGLLRAQESHVVIVSIEGFAAARLEDSELELPNLRGITRSGARAEGMETVYPATDHPAHVSLVTGVPPRQHGVLGNRLLNRRTGEYFHVTNLPRSKSIRVPTLFDAAKAKGLRTASFFWPGTRDDPAIDHAIPLVLTGEGKADIAGANPQFLDELRENGVPIDLFYQWYDDLALQQTADRVLTRAAIYVLTTYRPHLLLLRLPAPDRYQHQYGPQHYLSKAALTASDYNVGLVRRAIEDSGLANQTTLVVVS